MQQIISARNLTLAYERNEVVINSANLDIFANDFVFITGKSGSGKSTLLKSFYGEITPSAGDLNICMTSLVDIDTKKLSELRQRIGIIFQNYRLINEWSVERNVMLPLIIKGIAQSVCKKQVAKLLKHVNMLHKADKYPMELSGGEQQRVAMARALAHNPNLLLCDEPTGNLDEYSSDVIWSLLKSAREFLGTTIVVVTHHIPPTFRIPYRHFSIENGGVHEIA
ncbi:ABC transporter ATP-binding protein [Campylobacter sp. RM9344]|uniref:ABC transporter ATP-binding protein n=1 Tax=Campylobacter californiensis TaxID=1032243 RepID=A0AAW3ZX06_9BACT|nr:MULTISPECIES: ABC transporter ATP-binding protein [unclassified Campylobacter]MBE2984845.1 ABC transporter ATP-binding protein [Campylobacter sp. RM6883]MBE2986549.1 ABC transporter ATP-binding protein [Campylobacter sp. RM12919]MBE2987749.1 ABC transporter ATP-binding protein [Campylobacter sp. RM12920]MBE2994689.1 ABC transporter ATP-binding protein [Campylobacter sp. RM6913]MBE3021558.1 ABC transporter ATP-binding protein [Campylobacter sp. 7477a]MBE3030219.1 ABC transporter ATP-binding